MKKSASAPSISSLVASSRSASASAASIPRVASSSVIYTEEKAISKTIDKVIEKLRIEKLKESTILLLGNDCFSRDLLLEQINAKQAKVDSAVAQDSEPSMVPIEESEPSMIPIEESKVEAPIQKMKGIPEIRFKVMGSKVVLIDTVGKFDKISKRFVDCFENVAHALVFFVDLSDLENLVASVMLFHKISEKLPLVPKITVLTHKAQFEEKLATVKLTELFPFYRGKECYEDCVIFIQNFFQLDQKKKFEEPEESKIPRICYVCEDDSKMLEELSVLLQDVALDKALNTAGLVYI